MAKKTKKAEEPREKLVALEHGGPRQLMVGGTSRGLVAFKPGQPHAFPTAEAEALCAKYMGKGPWQGVRLFILNAKAPVAAPAPKKALGPHPGQAKPKPAAETVTAGGTTTTDDLPFLPVEN